MWVVHREARASDLVRHSDPRTKQRPSTNLVGPRGTRGGNKCYSHRNKGLDMPRAPRVRVRANDSDVSFSWTQGMLVGRVLCMCIFVSVELVVSVCGVESVQSLRD